jgi:hypothetical protein
MRIGPVRFGKFWGVLGFVVMVLLGLIGGLADRWLPDETRDHGHRRRKDDDPKRW